ncbi:MAG TPA: hypothetical protein DCX06_13560 [Opitutae bacterium]|nr:hypothetical protein [Opitutae bacterium]
MFKIQQLWTADAWKSQLSKAGLLDIDAVSQRDFDWFEEPNKRRGGWSGVARIVLNPKATIEQQSVVFLKIQQNHFYREPRKLFKKCLTFEREFDVLENVGKVSKCVPEVVLFAKWQNGSDVGSILITKALDEWYPLREWILGDNGLTPPDEPTFHRALDAIARCGREINTAGWVHLCFSAKHLFVKPEADGSFSSCVIDFEKSRKHLRSNYRTMKDCSHFMRHTPNLTDSHKRHFLESYFQTNDFTPAQRKLIGKMRGAPAV